MQDFPYEFIELLATIFSPIYTWIETNINSIFTNLFSTIVYVSIATLLLLIFQKGRKYFNSYKRIFRFSTKNNYINICYAMITSTIRSRSVFLLEQGDVTALYNLYDILSDIYGREKLIVLNHYDIQSNIARLPHFISISGPLYNKVTEKYIGHSGAPVFFSKEEKSIILCNHRKKINHESIFKSDYNENGVVKICYGILLRGKYTTSAGVKQSYFLCAGNSSTSTYTSILILRRMGLDRVFRKTMKKNGVKFNKKWCILFRVRNLAEADILSLSMPIDDSSLNYEVVRYFSEKDFVNPYEYHY